MPAEMDDLFTHQILPLPDTKLELVGVKPIDEYRTTLTEPVNLSAVPKPISADTLRNYQTPSIIPKIMYRYGWIGRLFDLVKTSYDMKSRMRMTKVAKHVAVKYRKD